METVGWVPKAGSKRLKIQLTSCSILIYHSLYILTQFIIQQLSRGKSYSHFTDGNLKPRVVKWLFQGHTAHRSGRNVVKPGNLVPDPRYPKSNFRTRTRWGAEGCPTWCSRYVHCLQVPCFDHGDGQPASRWEIAEWEHKLSQIHIVLFRKHRAMH